MKIVEIIPQLSPGGAERFVVDLCNELCKQNDVTLIVLHRIDKTWFLADEVNSKVKLISMNKSVGIDFLLPIRLMKLIKILKPDIVHTHLRSIMYISPVLLLLPLRCVHTLHNDAKIEASGWFGMMIRRFLFHKKNVWPVTISEASRESFVNLYHSDSYMIYNGSTPYVRSTNINNVYLDIDRFSKESFLIVNVARITEQKNQLQLAQAIKQLRLEGFDVELVLVGAILDKNIAGKIADLQAPYIHFLGPKNNPRDYIKDADAFCLSSKYEGMPITLIECFSVGTIPICTPVGGVVNMIRNGSNGLLSHDVSVDSIKDSLCRFIKMSDNDKESMREEALNSFAKYSISACAKEYEHLMNSRLNV